MIIIDNLFFFSVLQFLVAANYKSMKYCFTLLFFHGCSKKKIQAKKSSILEKCLVLCIHVIKYNTSFNERSYKT